MKYFNAINEYSLTLATPRKFSKITCLNQAFPQSLEAQRATDIGCGQGALISKFTSTGSWTFIDFNVNNLKKAQEHLKGTFICGDVTTEIEKIPSQNIITCLDVIMYFPNPEVIIKKISNALKINGNLYLIGTDSKNTMGAIIRRFFFLGKNPSGFLNETSAYNMKTMLESSGFKILSTNYFCGPFTQIFQSIIDVFAFLYSKKSKTKTGDRLTLDAKDFPATSIIPKKIIINFISVFSLLMFSLDKLFSWKKTASKFFDGYLIVASKK